MKRVSLKTKERCQIVDITGHVRDYVREKGVSDGVVTMYIPHTTAGVTINENGDPDVRRDLLFGLERMAPNVGFMHFEDNSDAHLKALITGNSAQVIVENGQLMLGRWQSIYFCEYDGPRSREFYIKISPDI